MFAEHPCRLRLRWPFFFFFFLFSPPYSLFPFFKLKTMEEDSALWEKGKGKSRVRGIL
jgi:hypothetical protein